MPGVPKLYFGAVDVRDVADMHLRCMTNPAAKGERFLAVAGDFVSLFEMAGFLKTHMGAAAKRLPTRQLPDWVVRLVALFDPSVRQILPELGKRKNGTNAKAKRLLGWSPRSNEDCIVATGESLVRYGLLKDSGKKKK
jgi:dihydroflavonol-4-reductase